MRLHVLPEGDRQTDTTSGETKAGRKGAAARSQGRLCPADDRAKRGREGALGTWKMGGQAHAWRALVPRPPPLSFKSSLECSSHSPLPGWSQIVRPRATPPNEKHTDPSAHSRLPGDPGSGFFLFLQEDDPMAA